VHSCNAKYQVYAVNNHANMVKVQHVLWGGGLPTRGLVVTQDKDKLRRQCACWDG